jgi:hypothetical protein
MHRCKKCKNGVLEYHYDYIGCEVETYQCTNCDSVFHVDIEIVRDFNNMREVQYES